MNLNKDWIIKNWNFLSSRRQVRLPVYRWLNCLQDGQMTSEGKFFGLEKFLNENKRWVSTTYSGNTRLLLRPYFICDMPEESIEAIYINPKKFVFDDSGMISGVKSTFELPIYIFYNDCL